MTVPTEKQIEAALNAYWGDNISEELGPEAYEVAASSMRSALSAALAVEGEAAYWVAETRMGFVPAAPYQPHAIPLYRHPAPTPVVIHFEEAGHYQLMTVDVPTFTGQPMTVQPLRDMQTREIVGFQWDAIHAVPAPHQEGVVGDVKSNTSQLRKFQLGDSVRKHSGSWWEGRVVGYYSTKQTPRGYCVQLDVPNGPVQIYPEAALEPTGE